ncbi:MAG: Stp1/IreP family PP2C-type Ser/Thr phosphatase [Caldisericia bacterium]|nr:Stp1/IreP family PP2C-type Ser/Thr phosphatase [Caldisericia bacterium]
MDQKNIKLKEFKKTLPTKYSYKTDKGKVRELNEDCYLIYEPKDPKKLKLYGKLYGVADGVGGYSRGDEASKLALKVIKEVYYSLPENIKPEQRIKISIEKANEEVYKEGFSQNESKIATTVCLIILIGDKLYVANVGDSRAYIIRKNKIKQITVDHSLVEEQVRAGLITKEEAKRSKYRNIITRGLGLDNEIKIDIFIIKVKNRDKILLTTDGLVRVVDDDEILKIIKNYNINDTVENLIKLANNRGGPDNITTVLVNIGKKDIITPILIFLLLLVTTLLLTFPLYKEKLLINGLLKIDSDPQGAEVLINNEKKGITPISIQLKEGSYEIVLKKDSYENFEKKDIHIEKNKPLDLGVIKLTPLPSYATLEVETTPTNAKLYLDGEEKGVTPYTVDKLKPGEYEIKITKSGYEDYKEKITLKDNENKTMKIQLKAITPTPTTSYGFLSVDSDPSGANVYVDNKNIGKTPIKSYKLETGTYNIKISLPGYNDYISNVTISSNSTKKLGKIELLENGYGHLIFNLGVNFGGIEFQILDENKEEIKFNKKNNKLDNKGKIELKDLKVGSYSYKLHINGDTPIIDIFDIENGCITIIKESERETIPYYNYNP